MAGHQRGIESGNRSCRYIFPDRFPGSDLKVFKSVYILKSVKSGNICGYGTRDLPGHDEVHIRDHVLLIVILNTAGDSKGAKVERPLLLLHIDQGIRRHTDQFLDYITGPVNLHTVRQGIRSQAEFYSKTVCLVAIPAGHMPHLFSGACIDRHPGAYSGAVALNTLQVELKPVIGPSVVHVKCCAEFLIRRSVVPAKIDIQIPVAVEIRQRSTPVFLIVVDIAHGVPGGKGAIAVVQVQPVQCRPLDQYQDIDKTVIIEIPCAQTASVWSGIEVLG